MGKYIRKGKITGEVAVREVSRHHLPSLGVRTRARAKTLALQRLQKSKARLKPSPCSSSVSSSSSASSKSTSCYLQLRSRRLEKCFLPRTQRTANPRTIPNPVSSPKGSKMSVGSRKEEEKSENDAWIEVSFGENVLEAEGKGSRNSRETTPCSLIRRDTETIGTPGSTTRPMSTTASNRRVQSSTRRNFPNSNEMEEFFAVPEQRQQKVFAEKYNFDPVKDSPLPGRYEWVKLDN